VRPEEEREAAVHLDGAVVPWAESRTREPRSRLDRLVEVVTGGSVPAGADIIFLAATQREELGRIPGLAHFIAPGGVLWVIRPRGGREITEQDVAVSAKAAGMSVGRAVRFSPTHTADRLTPPSARRRQGR